MATGNEQLYYVFRRCVTGCTEYLFLRGKKRLGRGAAYTARNFPVYLEGCGQVLRSETDPEMTVFPGCFREVISADGKGLYARVVYRETGAHSLQTGFGTIEVRHEGAQYRFFREGKPIARMRSVTGESPVGGISEDNWQWRLAMATEEPLPDALALLMMGFPLLQISL